MHCQVCENLKLALKARTREYVEASSDAYSRATNRFAAYVNVEMERARTELQEHRMVCLYASNDSAFPPVADLRRRPIQSEAPSLSVKSVA